jgi:hypothetical protein
MSDRYCYIILIALLSVSATSIHAQSIPIGSIPTFYNGGFAGETGTARVASFSYFVPRKDFGTGSTNMLSYDNFFKKARLGVGIMAGQSDKIYAFYYTQMLFSKISLSPKFSIKGKYTIAPFVDFAIQGSSAGVAAGFLVNSMNSYVGLTYSSYLNSETHSSAYPIPLLQAGHTFRRTPESKFSATLQVALGHLESPLNRNYFHKDVNLTFRKGKFIWGANFFSGGLLLGYQSSNFRMQFNQSIGEGGSYAGSSYNCSMAFRYIFNKRKE